MKTKEKEQKIEAVSAYICKNRVNTDNSTFISENDMEARIAAVKKGEVYNAGTK